MGTGLLRALAMTGDGGLDWMASMFAMTGDGGLFVTELCLNSLIFLDMYYIYGIIL